MDIINSYISSHLDEIEKKYHISKSIHNNSKEIKPLLSLLKQNMIAKCKIHNMLIDKETKKHITLFITLVSIAGYINEEISLSDNDIGLLSNCSSYNVKGIIKGDDIYDKNLPYLNESISNNLQKGNIIIALIKDIDIDSISFTLLNSVIKNKKQYTLNGEEVSIKFILGTLAQDEFNFFDESYLDSKLNKYHLNNIYPMLDFPYDKIRKVQNYDWSDIYVQKGEEEKRMGNYEKALEYLSEAQSLDPLNNMVYENRIEIYTMLGNIEMLKKECKSYLHIKPNDERTKEILSSIIKEKPNEYLSKKRKNK